MGGTLQASTTPLAQSYDVALLDLDGVVYVGGAAVDRAPGSLAAARDLGMHLAYTTNNASRTPATVAGHLSALGVPADPHDVITSAMAAARVASELVPPGSRVLVVGGDGLHEALEERGLEPVLSADDDPAAVVQGYAPDLDWYRLAEGAYALAHDIPWAASNTDLTIPTPRGRAPGNGTLVQVLRLATGKTPVVAGKPELPMHREAMMRTSAQRPLVVGDRLDTDIEAATRADVASLLVLTGVTRVDEVLIASEHLRPTFLSGDLRGLLVHHPPAVPVDGGWQVRGAWASVVAGVLQVRDGGDRELSGDVADGEPSLDAVRAACAASWTAADAGQSVDVGDAVDRHNWSRTQWY